MPTTTCAPAQTRSRHSSAAGEDAFHSRLRQRLADRIGEAKSRLYFNGESGVQLRLEREGELRVSAPTPFLAERLERGFAGDIAWAAEQILGAPPRKMRFDVVAPCDAEPEPAAPKRSDSRRRAAPRPSASGDCRKRQSTPSEEDHRLDTFIVGECNRLAHAAALRLANFDDDAGLRLLVVHGGCGLGKTHLLNGVARAIRENNGGRSVARMTGEAFTNRFQDALRAKNTAAFRRDVRRVSALCIDDAQQFVGRSATLQEFMHTLDAVIAAGGRAVVVLDNHPASVTGLPTELRSRLQAGLVASLEPPDPATRERLARAFAGRRSIRLSDEALAALARTRFPSVREIQGVINRMALFREVERADSDAPLGLRTLRKALSMDARLAPSKPPAPDVVLRVVCDALVVDSEDVLSGARHQRVVLARAMAAHLLRAMTTLSYPEIARALRRPNHSSVITAVRRVERQVAAAALCDAGPRLGELSIPALVERLRELVLERAAAARR